MRGFEVHPGDVIVSCAGTIGETYVLPDNIEKGIINQALMRMQLFKPMHIPYFLVFFDVVLKQNAMLLSRKPQLQAFFSKTQTTIFVKNSRAGRMWQSGRRNGRSGTVCR